MSNSTHDFIDKIKQQQNQQREMIEQEHLENLKTLRRNMNQQFTAADDLITKNMGALKSNLRKYKWRPWIYPLIATLLGSLMLLPTIYAGEKLWGLIIVAKTSQAETLEKTLEEHNKALRAIGTAGIQHTIWDGRLVLILQKGAKKPKPLKSPYGEWVLDLGE